MHRSAWILGLGLIAISHARAQEGLPLELSWQAPAGCPSASDIRDQLERGARVRAGYSLTPLSARADVQKRGDAYVLNLETDHAGQKGERRLEARDCETLARTLVLVLALTFGAGVEIAEEARASASSTPSTMPAATSDAQTIGPATNPEQTSPPAVPTPARAEPAAQPQVGTDDATRVDGIRGRTRMRWSLLLGGGAQFALLPATAFAAAAGVELAIEPWSVGLRASAWPGFSQRVTSDVQAHFAGLGGTLQGCGRLTLAPLMFAVCGGARAAALQGRSSGPIAQRSATAPWYALATSGALTWPSGSWLSARLEASLAISLDRPRFVIDGLQQVHRVPLLAPDLSLSLLLTP